MRKAYRWHADIVKRDCVNGHMMPTGKVLLDTRQESMCKVEARDPEDSWRALLNPLGHHVETLCQVCNVAAQGLHARV